MPRLRSEAASTVIDTRLCPASSASGASGCKSLRCGHAVRTADDFGEDDYEGSLSGERRDEYRRTSEFGFDFQKAVVFRDPFASAQ